LRGFIGYSGILKSLFKITTIIDDSKKRTKANVLLFKALREKLKK